jgi:ubiquinone/menaquinone biosynthesis C-methylase UbiE
MMLHHLPAAVRAQCLQETRRVLKPGGRVLIVDFGGRPAGRGGLLDRIHRHGGIDLTEIVAGLREAGLRAEESGALDMRGLSFVLGKR